MIKPTGAGMTKVNEARLRSSTLASVWAAEFAKVCPEVDEGLMIGWFANAIETGRDAGAKRWKERCEAAEESLRLATDEGIAAW